MEKEEELLIQSLNLNQEMLTYSFLNIWKEVPSINTLKYIIPQIKI